MMLRNGFCIFLILTLSACVNRPSVALLKEHDNELIVKEDFGFCKGYGCRYYMRTAITEREWQQVSRLFDAAAENAAQEREVIKKAIGLLEKIVGPKTDTDNDDAGAQIINFSLWGQKARGQMDCIDEAFNSSTYLFLLRKAGFIKFHSLGQPLRRGYFIDRWPHNTATIHEIGTEKVIKGKGHYVVDSWFHANGEAPEIIPASSWATGWSPEKK